MDCTRFDDRRTITAIIGEMIGRGIDLEDLDLKLSRFGPVDLDLLNDCLAEALQAFADRPHMRDGWSEGARAA